MKLKQIELAQLAAKLVPFVDRDDCVKDSVKLALEIWEESGNALYPKPAPEVAPAHMDLDAFLRILMPKPTVAYRTKAMRDFQKWLIRGGTNPTGEVEVMVMNEIFATERKKVKATDAIITRLAETRMKALRENGVHNAPEMRRLFKKWRSLRPKTPSNKTEVPTEVPTEDVKPQKKPKKP